MSLSKQIAKHFREVYFGGNWSWSNLKDHLSNVNWQQATRKVHSFNTIAALVYHINYFTAAVLKVLEGGPLEAHDKYSFARPAINSEADWQHLIQTTFSNAEKFALLVEELPESKLWEILAEEKYGTYYRNLHGIIEHAHYHLGQIVIIKKLIIEAE
jgi:uncharacterized damage-inducible protein DinB